jgi:hypothetical protein
VHERYSLVSTYRPHDETCATAVFTGVRGRFVPGVTQRLHELQAVAKNTAISDNGPGGYRDRRQSDLNFYCRFNGEFNRQDHRHAGRTYVYSTTGQ